MSTVRVSVKRGLKSVKLAKAIDARTHSITTSEPTCQGKTFKQMVVRAHTFSLCKFPTKCIVKKHK